MADKRRRKTPAAWQALRAILVLFGLAAILLGYRGCFNGWFNKSPDARFAVKLAKVIDGDTIRVTYSGEEIKVRLIGIDAAELGSAESFRCALRVAELLEAADAIEIEPEPTKPTDKYGRTLAWVWFKGGGGDWQLLQELLVEEGLCEIYRDAKGSKYFTRL